MTTTISEIILEQTDDYVWLPEEESWWGHQHQFDAGEYCGEPPYGFTQHRCLVAQHYASGRLIQYCPSILYTVVDGNGVRRKKPPQQGIAGQPAPVPPQEQHCVRCGRSGEYLDLVESHSGKKLCIPCSMGGFPYPRNRPETWDGP